MAWTLKFGSTEKSFADWGFSNLHRQTRNSQYDVVTFTQNDVAFDQDPAFVFDDEISIYRDGKQWFVGRIRSPKTSGDAESESITYTAHGALSWLDDLIFRQVWRYLTDKNDPDSNKFSLLLADLILFQKITNDESSIMTVAEQVQEIFDYLTSKWTGATPAIDPKLILDASKLPTHQAPFMEVSMISCALALEDSLKTVPDCAVWADYLPVEDSSANPVPRIRIARRGTAAQVASDPANYLSAVTLTIPDEVKDQKTNSSTAENPIIKVDIEPREELKTKVVDVEYRQTNSVNGITTRFTVQDVFPIGSDITGFRVLPQVVNLEGTNVTFPQAVLSVRAIDKDNPDWWKLHHISLDKINIQNLVIREAQRNGNLPNEILPDSDTWSPWMGGAGEEDTIQCYADYDLIDTQNGINVVVERLRNQLLTIRVMTTNLASGLYNGIPQGTAGEGIPVGLAKALYEATSELHYDGTIVLEEAECSGLVRVGNVVNIISSKRPEWATARAMVQEVEEDIDNGLTTVTVGPPKFLGVSEIMDWLRGLRASGANLWTARISGLSYGTGPLRVAARAHKDSLTASKESRERIVLMRPDSQTQTTETLTAQIILDILDAHGKEIKLREEQICRDGVTKYKIILASDDYNTPLLPH